MMPAEPCYAMLDTMPEVDVRLSAGELNYLIGSLQYLNKLVQVHLENHTQVDGNELHAKLFTAWEALETND